MSAIKRKVHRLERHRAKIKGKSVPELEGKGKAESRAAKVVNIQAAVALKKRSGKLTREFDNLDVAALKAKLEETRKELFNLRFSQAVGSLEDHGRMKTVRRDIARIYTVARERELGFRTAPSTEEE